MSLSLGKLCSTWSEVLSTTQPPSSIILGLSLSLPFLNFAHVNIMHENLKEKKSLVQNCTIHGVVLYQTLSLLLVHNICTGEV